MSTKSMSAHEKTEYYTSIKNDVLLHCQLTAEEVLLNTSPVELIRLFGLMVDDRFGCNVTPSSDDLARGIKP